MRFSTGNGYKVYKDGKIASFNLDKGQEIY